MRELGFDGRVAIVTGAGVRGIRGNRFRHGKPEAISSEFGTHRLIRGSREPIASCPGGCADRPLATGDAGPLPPVGVGAATR